MSKALKNRIEKLETKRGAASLTTAEVDMHMEAQWVADGLTTEQVIAKHGSIPAYVYWRLCYAPSVGTPKPDDGRTAQERYMEMIGRG